jgi:hypothetical protein
MTTEELNKKIAESPHMAWYNSIKEKIHYKFVSDSPEFTTVSALHEYVFNQVTGWTELKKQIPSDLNNSSLKFTSLLQQIEHFIDVSISADKNNIQNIWQSQVRQNLHQLVDAFPFDSPETKFLLKVHTEFNGCFNGAFKYITNNLDGLTHRDNFTGAIMAYEFALRNSNITKRGEIEVDILNKLKSDYVLNLSKSNKQLTEHIKVLDQINSEYTAKITKWKDDNENQVSTWFKHSKETLESTHSEANRKIKELELTYEEKLRLQKPAEYWSKRAIVLKKEGRKYVCWMSILVLMAASSLYFLLWQTPEGMLKSFFNGNASAIKWSIVYITFISFMVFGIRALYKVAFSSFHLARDAEEREQLTYFYLALVKDKNVDEKDKSLILQSLFSRADTGLLKEDSSPTMPGVADKFVK